MAPPEGEQMKVTKLAIGAVSLGLALAASACGSSTKTVDQQASAGSAAGGLVGVTMPTKSSERWIHDGDNVKAALEKLGYKVDLQYAENDIPTQVNQIENQITKGAKLLAIASIDGTAITTQLQQAADNKIPVISYDRLIRNSPNVDYYATFDNFEVGVQQATSLLVELGLNRAAAHGRPADLQLRRRRSRQRRAVPVRRPVHRHPVRAQEQRLRHRRAALPDGHRPGRRARVGEVDHCR
jgi:ABC-type sugar transport system substrate-binding protein